MSDQIVGRCSFAQQPCKVHPATLSEFGISARGGFPRARKHVVAPVCLIAWPVTRDNRDGNPVHAPSPSPVLVVSRTEKFAVLIVKLSGIRQAVMRNARMVDLSVLGTEAVT